MAKLNGSILLSEKQIGELAQGKIVRIKREKKYINIGLKSKHNARVKILSEIHRLKEELKCLD